MYDGSKRKVAEAVRSDKQFVEAVLKRYRHDFPMADQSVYQRFNIDRNLYLQVLVPIKEDDRILGYFEGVYQVDRETVPEIWRTITWSISQTVAAVLLTTLLLYPVIMSPHKGLIRQSHLLLKANTDLLG